MYETSHKIGDFAFRQLLEMFSLKSWHNGMGSTRYFKNHRNYFCFLKLSKPIGNPYSVSGVAVKVKGSLL